MPTVVFIAPCFPPSAYLAAKRPARFVRHLRSVGWEPAVLTLPDGGGRGYDERSLLSLPEGLQIEPTYAEGLPMRIWERWEKTKSNTRQKVGAEETNKIQANLETQSRKNLSRTLYDFYNEYIGKPTARFAKYPNVPVDRWVLLAPTAGARAAELAKKTNASVLYVSAPPFSVILTGAIASTLSGLPLVLDLRDPWTLDPLYFTKKPPAVQNLENILEAICFQVATSIIVNTNAAKKAYEVKYPKLCNKFTTIYNGFDRSQQKIDTPILYDSLTLVHFGNLYAGRSLYTIIDALSSIYVKASIVCYGSVSEEEKNIAKERGILIEQKQAVPYENARSALDGASALLLVQPPETKVQIPAKLYDYLSSIKPILAVSSNPEIAEILSITGKGIHIASEDKEGLQNVVQKLANKTMQWPVINQSQIERFDASQQTKQLADILNQCALKHP